MIEKPSFFHTQAFNCWLITSFFTAFASLVFAVLPVLGAHRLGMGIDAELTRYETPAARELPAPEPFRLPEKGMPVAFQAARVGP